MSESVVASTARPMSRVASTAATKGFCFFSSMKRTMFSSTTMASSMTMPTASASASSVMMLSVKPIAHISAKVPMMEIGMASAAMIVLRTLPRKMSTTSAAKSAPRTRCSLTASTLVRIDAELSRTTSSSEPGGQRLLHLVEPRPDGVDDGDGVLARLLADREDHARLAVLERPRSSAPPRRPRRARRRRRASGGPGSRWMTMRPISATSSTRPSTRSERLFGPVSICPPGTLRFCAAMARSHVDGGEPGGLRARAGRARR